VLRLESRDTGVSLVTGLIVIVAVVTIITLALSGMFFLFSASDTSSPNARIDINQYPSSDNSSTYDVDVNVMSMQDADYVLVESSTSAVKIEGGNKVNDKAAKVKSVGVMITMKNLSDGDKIRVYAVSGNTEKELRTHIV
jgi:YbbR domain-containing protein